MAEPQMKAEVNMQNDDQAQKLAEEQRKLIENQKKLRDRKKDFKDAVDGNNEDDSRESGQKRGPTRLNLINKDE